MPTNALIYIYITKLNYITNVPKCFGVSAPFSGSLFIVLGKVIKC